MELKRSAGVEPSSVLPEDAPPAEQFCRHFFRCFFCRIGFDSIEGDHFCEEGRELMVAMLDEMDGRP